MWHRHSIRQLLLTIVLSQVLAIQGLLLAVSGSLAVAGAGSVGVGAICANAALPNGGWNDPLGPDRHQDCLSACLSGRTSGEAPSPAAFLAPPVPHECWSASQGMTLLAISQARAFLARAPPMLT